jgi:predicted Rossmann fold flavoprotein
MDFMEDYSETEIAELLKKRCAALPEKSAGELLVGTVHNRLGKMLVKYAQVDGNRTLRELSEDELKHVASAMKGFTLSIKGTEGFEQAQVTAGGIRTSEFDPATMQSRIVPGLYACGEVLDIDGDCGGFNLQWAWSSGRLAGRLLP